jgi:hypothetical protein
MGQSIDKIVINKSELSDIYRLDVSGNINVDGSNILLFAHSSVIDQLTTQGNDWFPVTDPSTGEQIYDPSTWRPVLEEQVIVPKFCEPEEISVVDVSINV